MSGVAVIDAVVSLCRGFGYGRVMQIAETAWRRKDPRGALVVVCCAAEESLYRAAPELLEALKGEATEIDGRLCWCTQPNMIKYRGHDSGCESNRELVAKATGKGA